jgi:hypothetical protein
MLSTNGHDRHAREPEAVRDWSPRPRPGRSGAVLLASLSLPGLIAAKLADRGADWASRIAQDANAGGWKAEMLWFKTVNPSE